jgi:transcriptional regulator with AAA-type ATPase domain/tetratricopeptide (TPR) repeat protein
VSADLGGLLGRNPRIAALREQMLRVLGRQAEAARRSPPILILGETGTGKGLVAATIHREGIRARGPFIDVNCAAIPETLLEAELFGWERGAFTDARQAKPGLFQAANGGTIFLDEIGLLPTSLQSKLLKVIDERQVRRLGSTRSEAVDVWVIAATSEDLDAAILARRFREDLYHRLAVLTLRLPPLRERGDDVVLLAEHFLARSCEDYGLPTKTLTPDACGALRAFPWPGNVRQLANVMERAALFTDSATVDADALGLASPARSVVARGEPPAVLEDAMRDVERVRLLDALEQSGGNITRAATRLGIPRNTLRYRLDRHGLGLDAGSARRRGGRPPGPPARHDKPDRSVAPAPLAAPVRESRRLTLLYATLVGAREESHSPVVTRALESVIDKARSFGGWVESVRPGGVVVVFGIDSAEDAARRAVHAAVAIRQLAVRARRDDPLRPEVSVAVHTGSLMTLREDREVTLEPEGMRTAASVLEALASRADPGGVIISGGAAGALSRRFELAPMDLDSDAEATYRLVSPAERETGRAGFVGRERELRLLTERFEEARAGAGQVLMIGGEPGVGKSRLLQEFRRRLGDAAAWVEAPAVPFGLATPLHSVVQMLRQACRIEDGDSAELMADKLERRVRRLDDRLASTLPFLRALLGIDPGDSAVSAMDPQLRRVEIFNATHRMLARAAESHPHVVVLEDAHWVDAATGEWMARLAESLARQRVLLIVTYRPGYAPPFGDHTFHTRLALTTLSTTDSVRMAADLLGADRLPAELEALIVAKAEGNPFFVEELVRSVEELGVVRREGSRLVMARPLDAALVPDTIQDVVTARIDRLAEGPRRLLRLAAVVGREFTRRLLDQVLESGTSADPLLRELRAVELIHEQRLFPEVSYAFKHALTHDVAYASIPGPERQALHRRIAAALEALHGDRVGEVAGVLARHYAAAEDWEAALVHLVRAAEAAARAFATRDALALYDEALEVAGRLSGVGARVMAIHQAKSALYFVVSDFERSRQAAERARELAHDAGDATREGVALAAMAWAATWARDLDGAVAHARQAIDVAEPVGADAVVARAQFTIGFVRGVTGGLDEAKRAVEYSLTASRSGGDMVHHSLSLSMAGLIKTWEADFAAADQLQVEGLAIAREHNLLMPLLFSAFMRGLTLTGKGDYTTALSTFHEGLELAEKVGDEVIHHRLLNCLGWLHFELGDFDGAAELNGRSADGGRRRNDPGTMPNAELNLGDIALARGDLALAGEMLDRVERFARDPATSAWMRFRYSIRLYASLGELALARGDLDQAAAHARRCLELAARTNARKNLVKGWRLTGEVASAAGRWQEAEHALGEARPIAETIGNPTQLWHTHAALARLHAAQGREDAARRAAGDAVRVIDGVLGGLSDPRLRASFERLALVREMRARAIDRLAVRRT